MHSEGQPTSETRLFSRPIVLVTVAGLVAIAAAAVVVGIASGGRSGSSVEPSDSAAFFLRGSGRRYLALTPLGRGKTRILKLPRALGNVDLDEVSMAFSPDGSTLSFLAGGTFFVVETRSLRMKRLVSKRELGRGADAASLSPDGRHVAVVHTLFERNSSCRARTWISVVANNGTSRRLAALPEAARPTPDRTILIASVSWSPNGHSLLYTVDRFAGPNDCRTNDLESVFLFRIPASGGRVIRLRKAADYIYSPQWSPRGDLIAYIEGNMAFPGTPSNVFVVRPDGSRRRELTHFVPTQGVGDQGLSFAWSRTGRIVVAHVRGVPMRSDVGLYDIDPRSNGNRRFSQFESESVLAVSPDGRLVAVAGQPDVVILSLVDGEIRRRTRLTSPRSDLRVEDYSPVAVYFSP